MLFTPGYWPALRVVAESTMDPGNAVRSNALRLRARLDRLPVIANVDSEAAELLRAGFPVALTVRETTATAIAEGWQEPAARTLRDVLGRYIELWGSSPEMPAEIRDDPSRQDYVERAMCEQPLDRTESYWAELVRGTLSDVVD